MKVMLLPLVLFLFPTVTTEAQSLSQYRWKSRLVLLFTPAPNDPIFKRQVELLAQQTEALEERKLVLLFITPTGKFEKTGRYLGEAESRKTYEKFGVVQNQFEMLLIGLDGYEKFRAKNQLTPPSVLFGLIDGMPMRKQEIRKRDGTKSSGVVRSGL